MLAQVVVMEEEDGATRSRRRAQIADAYRGLRSYVAARAAFLQGSSGVQCALAWCAAGQPDQTLLAMVNTISTVNRVGSGGQPTRGLPTCVADLAPPSAAFIARSL